MKVWKLIALDMDGTVLNKDGVISQETKRAIQDARKHGIEVTFATGRHFLNAREFSTSLGFTAPLVTSNGSEVWTADGILLHRSTFSKEEMEFLYNLAVLYRTHFWAYSTENRYLPDTFSASFIREEKWIKFGFQTDDTMKLYAIWEGVRKYGNMELSNSDPSNIEVNPNGVTKAKGLAIVCEHLKIEPESVVTMGDSLNDIPMLEWSGFGVAMGNAQDQVKKIADYVTSTNEEHGVAQCIKFLLTKS